jgi:GNAT superfamily N-acetyltransferase
LPELILKDEIYYVPPFPGSIVKIIRDDSFFKNHGQIFCFIAYKNDQPVGRIAAIVNRSHNQYHKDKVGFFGYFDCIHDQEVANKLFETARETLKTHGLESMRGPYNPTINDECGLLIDGFDSIPNVMMTFNPAYYVELYEKFGLAKARDLNAFYISSETMVQPRIQKILDRVRQRANITFRDIDLKNLDNDLVIMREVYNRTLDRNWGFYPITQKDVEHSAGELKMIVDPDMVMIAMKDGKSIGFSLSLPNLNEFMWKLKKLPIFLRVLGFLWLLKTSLPKEARAIFLGVLPEYRSLGIGPVFYAETLVRGKKFIGGEMGWIEENNKEITHGIEVIGGHKYKSYRIYEKAI